MMRLDLIGPGFSERQVVVRAHGPADLARNPDIALDEYRVLQVLVDVNVPVPRPLHVDQSGEFFPVPVLVLEYVTGETVLKPAGVAEYALQMADMLRFINSFEPAVLDLGFLPTEGDLSAARVAAPSPSPDAILQEERIRSALSNLLPGVNRNPNRLLHGDFWPGNVLWEDGTIKAVIDWEDVCQGDPLMDVANTRLELLWTLGDEAMEVFTEAYLAKAGIDAGALPVFDLLAALRPAGRLSAWNLSPTRHVTMVNAHRSFVAKAMAELGDG